MTVRNHVCSLWELSSCTVWIYNSRDVSASLPPRKSFRGKVTINPHEVCSKGSAVSSKNPRRCWLEFSGHAHVNWGVFVLYSDSRDWWCIFLSSYSMKYWILPQLPGYPNTRTRQGHSCGMRFEILDREGAQARTESLKSWGSKYWQAQRQMWQTAKTPKAKCGRAALEIRTYLESAPWMRISRSCRKMDSFFCLFNRQSFLLNIM